MKSVRSCLQRRYPILARLWGKFRWYTSRRGISQLLADGRLAVQHWGSGVECPFCGWRGREFYRHLDPHPRPNAVCPRCHSKERHRLLYLYLVSTGVLSDAARHVLEIGPERCWPLLLRSLANINYVGLDLASANASVQGDVVALPLPSQSFDLVICYHVLEHVMDDRKAIQELHRVLSPRGILLVDVPIHGEVTDEDPTVTDPVERGRRFGQADHVHQYGADFVDRLVDRGFAVEVCDFASKLADSTVQRLGLVRNDPIYVCRRCILH